MAGKIEAIVLNSHGVGQYADTEKMPEWGETLKVTNWRIEQDGGKGSNVACALGRLGLKTAYVGKVGNDPWGDLGEKWMQDAGVDTTFLYRTDEVATGTGLILLGPNGENSIIDGDSSSVKLTQEEVFTAINTFCDARLLITGFEIPEKIALAGAKHAKELGMLTALNPSPLPDEPMGLIDYVDYLFINEVEGAFILDLTENEILPHEEMLHRIRTRYQCENVILTLGTEGSCALTEGDQFWMIPVTKVSPVVNTAGAGDGFMAAACYQLLRTGDLKSAMEWASQYAALTVTIHGTIPAYRPLKEVEDFIASLS